MGVTTGVFESTGTMVTFFKDLRDFMSSNFSSLTPEDTDADIEDMIANMSSSNLPSISFVVGATSTHFIIRLSTVTTSTSATSHSLMFYTKYNDIETRFQGGTNVNTVRIGSFAPTNTNATKKFYYAIIKYNGQEIIQIRPDNYTGSNVLPSWEDAIVNVSAVTSPIIRFINFDTRVIVGYRWYAQNIYFDSTGGNVTFNTFFNYSNTDASIDYVPVAVAVSGGSPNTKYRQTSNIYTCTTNGVTPMNPYVLNEQNFYCIDTNLMIPYTE